MRTYLTRLAALAFVGTLAMGFAEAGALPLPAAKSIAVLAETTSPVESVGYRHYRRYGYQYPGRYGYRYAGRYGYQYPGRYGYRYSGGYNYNYRNYGYRGYYYSCCGYCYQYCW